ncbi:hypothetical protein ACFQH2_10500 [Natronoarchaeum sp. GCM10025703]
MASETVSITVEADDESADEFEVPPHCWNCFPRAKSRQRRSSPTWR